jgi:hypothetical protein
MSNISVANLAKTPKAVIEQPVMDPDAAAWADLLDNWLGPEHDVYARLLDRQGESASE